MVSPTPHATENADDPGAPFGEPATLSSDVVPVSVAGAFRTLVSETRATTFAYLRMIRRPKDISWKHVTLASIDRVAFAVVGVAVAMVRSVRRRGGREGRPYASRQKNARR